MGKIQKLKGLFLRGSDDDQELGHVPLPPSLKRRVSAGQERPMPIGITPYDDVKAMIGIRVPALKFYSADPYASIDARLIGKNNQNVPLLPGINYPVPWIPAERWPSPALSEDERRINFAVPLGRTHAMMGMTKKVETQAFVLIPISQMPYGWARLGIVGRERFDLDVVSADFDSRTEYATKRFEIERLLRSREEKALMEIVGTADRLPEEQRLHAYDEVLRGLGLGGVDEILKAKDPEAEFTKLIEVVTKARDEYKRSKR